MHRSLLRLSYACVALGLMASGSWAQMPASTSPTFGNWKGFHSGDFIVSRITYRGVGWRGDGMEFHKTVLTDVSRAGAGGYFEFKSEQPDGPWTPIGSHGDVSEGDARLGATVHVVELPSEAITVGSNSFSCKALRKTTSDDWGTKTKLLWIDSDSDLEVQSRETYEGQDDEGRPIRWELSLRTVGLETITIGKEQISCLVQERVQSFGSSGELRWHFVVSAKVPGRLVSSSYWRKKDVPPEVETTVVAWGHDPGLLAEIRTKEKELGIVREADIQKQRQAEKKKNREDVERHEKQTLADLQSPDAGKRFSAVNSLAASPISEAHRDAVIAGLTGALADPDPEVRRRAAWGLGQRGVKGLTDRILSLLHQDPGGTCQYINALGLQAAPEGLPIIIQMASATNLSWRNAAVYALRNFKTEDARTALETAIRDSDWNVRHHAVESLVIIGNSRSINALIAALRDDNQIVARAAIAAIARLGDDNSVSPLLDLFNSSNEDLRRDALLHLGEMRLNDARPAADVLLKALDDESREVRTAAIVSLGKLRVERAVPLLMDLTRHPAGPPQGFMLPPETAAFFALGQIGTPSALARLIELLDDPKLEGLAFMALAEGREAAAGPLLDRYVRVRDRSRNDKTMELLGKLGTKETISSLSDYLAHARPREKAPIRRAIEQIQVRQSP